MLKTVLVAGSVLAFAVLVGCAGGSGRPHPDWRQPRPCASDAECGGGKCVVGSDDTQARCTGGALPPLPPGGQQSTDGGARPPAPAPSIQPAPGDIQI